VAKYDPLFKHLSGLPDGPVELTFDEVARLVGGLPASAERLRVWWANSVDGRSVQAKAWLDAGRQVTDVDVASRVVRFSAAEWRRGS
jgi:hypothetical protein